MVKATVFSRHHNHTWSDIDELNEYEDLDETRQEAESYEESVKLEIEWKGSAYNAREAVMILDDNQNHEQSNRVKIFQTTVDDSVNFDTPASCLSRPLTTEPIEAPPPFKPTAAGTSNDISFIPPSFNHAHFLQSSTPRAHTGTFPTISTPSENGTPQLPRPTSQSRNLYRTRSSKILDTPDHIASPVDSPSSTCSRPILNSHSDSVGKAKRDDPATPVAIGKSALFGIKSKQDHLTITKHFDTLAKALVKGPGAGSNSSKSKQSTFKALSMASGLGGKVFQGLRFCLTSEVNQTSKLKLRADVISNLGGQAVLQPDTAITHVVYDLGRSASLLAHKLGLDSLSQLPEGTICVKWDWIVQCKMAGKILDSTPWLSFPKTSFSRAVSANAIRPTSRILDITDQLRGKSIAITKKREATASDSDTEESAKRRSYTTQARSIQLFPPVYESTENTSIHVDATVATDHALPSGPGWQKAVTNERDALDVMIEGIVEGSLEDPEASEDDGEVLNENTRNVSKVDSHQDSNRRGEKFKCGQKHDGKGYTGPNEWLAKKFEELHELYQGQVGKNSFAIRGYQRAAGIMRRIDYPITTGAQARAIPGIGQSLADRIDEFLSGAHGRAFYENTEQARCVSLFKDIYGVGRQNANDLYRLGARSIDDLRSGRYPLTAGQKIGLQLYEDLKGRIPREECKDIFEIIRSEAQAIDDKLWVEIMGSYRRGQESSGDVDILVTREGGEQGKKGVLGELVKRLKKKGLVTHDLGTPNDWNAPEAKWMGVGRLSAVHKHRRIDILCIPFENWGAALLYFTGNEVFNRSMRLYARKTGFSLNQRGLYKGVIRGKDGLKQTEGELVASQTEHDIFDALGLRWRHPHHRRP
ncbi:uncharacterized protein L201_006809 [Kwoniella dendrophila CBS 6074]|uniref:DNA polymerase lambda n=1 Tax=Kwoniella dendrophila CBS 6074 TaxID=1295534 RepID=A0AAX4K2Q0_9TREE